MNPTFLDLAAAACTLPTAEQPLRVAEFGTLFSTALRVQRRLSATTLRWEIDPTAAASARELAGRETSCCSFFTFDFPSPHLIDVGVPPPYTEVLDALAEQAAAALTRRTATEQEGR